MTRWWQWHKRKPLLTLLSERVAWRNEASEAGLLRLSTLNLQLAGAHPNNRKRRSNSFMP